MKRVEAQETDSPNAKIDVALNDLMETIKAVKDRTMTTEDKEVAVKIINSAIAWEKVKHKILEKDEEFDPDEL